MGFPAAPADSVRSPPLLWCGRRPITAAHVAEIQQVVAAHPDWTREALAVALCRAWDWRRGDGTLNRATCQTLLRRLATRGLVTLPRPRRVPGPHWRPVVEPELVVPLPSEAVLRDLVVRPLAPRDQWIGWDAAVRERRLHFLANNTRFLILPGAAGRKNLASKVLGLTLQRLSPDWQRRYGHPLLLVETFVDPSRFTGTCDRAAGWQPLGLTRGYARQAAGYVAHGQPTMIFVRLLHPEARHQLRAPWSPPRPTPEGDRMPHVDVNRLPLEGAGGLVEALATVPDPRQRRGIRHPVRGILAVSAAATLAGARSFQAIAEFAAELAPDLLRRLGIPRGAAPSVKCFRLTLQKLDGHHFDRVLSAWLVQHQILAGQPLALDGKTRRSSASATTPARHLLSAILPDLGVVIAQQAVPATTNEIPCVAPLLAPLPMAGAVVTGDALHTQAATARYLVAEKQADDVFTVKAS